MADKIKDADDLMLESLLRSEPIVDDGFSNLVLRRIRRKLWVRRLALPIAFVIGGSIAVKPLAGLVKALYGLAAAIPVETVAAVQPGWMPSIYEIVLGGMLLAAAILGIRLLSD